MRQFVTFASMIVTGCVMCCAQLQPRTRPLQNIENPEMVINDRGSKLEVFTTRRATPGISKSGQQVYRVITKGASASISPKQLGVVFNHAMQVQGYINGEIAFKFRDNTQPTTAFVGSSFPSFKKLTNPNVYLVVARTPAEFIELVKRLQQMPELEWVEPMVLYGQLAAPGNTQ